MNRLLLGIAIVSLTVIFGCKSEETYQKPTSASYMSNSFNQETYVWENFLFPTNRTSGVQ